MSAGRPRPATRYRSFREAKGGDVQPPLSVFGTVLLGRAQFSKGGMLTFATARNSSLTSISEPQDFFRHTFPVPSSQTRNPNREIIHRHYSIGKLSPSPETDPLSPANHFGGSLTKGQQVHK